jgi:adhesin/invasin
VANAGNAQVGTVGQQLGRPLTVLVTDASGNPAPFQTNVTWILASGSGTISAATDTLYLNTVVTQTDGNGFTSVTWTLGTKSGSDSLTATTAGNLTTTFSATAQPGAVTQLVDQSGNTQTIPDGTTSQPFVVQAQDQYGNPVPNVSINFTDQTGGTLSSGSAVTDANGIASVQLTAAASPATYTIVAAVAGQTTIATTFSASSN